MIQQENPTLPCADAGPASAAFSENPKQYHTCGSKMRHQRTRLCGKNRPAKAARPQSPARSAHQTLQP